ncbi:uncharacterized protein LOC118426238 [Branchiostoma floridae]|uniref:Uncharacterized protein LOC118426238 n=1 Tax=Branchiostoma floridae TaxID=7739 RepID=A0A9J7N4G5_BRAFL|nr:uncharacterized protein LOC118426238 [Branchiostoma floridae]
MAPSNAEKEWQQLDEDLEGILESVLAGAAERKIEAMMEIVYSVGVERFGEKPMLGAKTSGKLTASVEEVEIHLRATHGDQHRDSPIEDIEGMEEPAPVYPMDCSEIKLSEVKEVVQKARAGSAPGPSGITYKVYKKCPKLVRRLWKLLKVLWRKEKIPESWKKAEGVFCPKQENSLKIDQFRTISLLSVECKIYFAILAKRLLHFMLRNNYIDTSVQKGGVPGFSGCLEHTSILTQLIQEAKTEKKDLSVVWLDLENAYGSVPHQLIKMALNKCHVPQQACRVISQYLDGLQIRFTVNGNTTAWQSLQRGIITGCTISVILFVAAMNLVMKPAMLEEVERKISRHLRKWLGLPPSFTRLGLYSRTARLQLPFTSVVEEFKVCKTRALMTLEGSKDEKVSQAGVELRSGRKWSVAKAVQEAKSSLRHRDIVGVVAQGRLGLGAGKTDHQCSSYAVT